MILTGRKLEEIGRALYGSGWAAILAERLDRTRQTVNNWRGGAPMPKELKVELSDTVEHQIDVLTAYWRDLTEDLI